jgi:hypothetical protein
VLLCNEIAILYGDNNRNIIFQLCGNERLPLYLVIWI